MNVLSSPLTRLIVALAASLLVGACAGGGGARPSADAPSAGGSRSSVEVFGVIDAGVSHVTTKSERR